MDRRLHTAGRSLGCSDVILCCCPILDSNQISVSCLLLTATVGAATAIIQISHYCRSVPPSLSSKRPEWTLSHILFSTTSNHSSTSSRGTLAVRQVHSRSRSFPESQRHCSGRRVGLFEVTLCSLTVSAECLHSTAPVQMKMFRTFACFAIGWGFFL